MEDLTEAGKERVKDYQRECLEKGRMWALEFEENEVHSIGSVFESLIDDYAYFSSCEVTHTKEELTALLSSIDVYCLDDSDDGFYDNVHAAILGVCESYPTAAELVEASK